MTRIVVGRYEMWWCDECHALFRQDKAPFEPATERDVCPACDEDD